MPPLPNSDDLRHFVTQFFLYGGALWAGVVAIIKTARRFVQNRRFNRLKIRGYLVSSRKLPHKKRRLYELIEVRSRTIGVEGRPVCSFGDQDYRMNLSFSAEHP